MTVEALQVPVQESMLSYRRRMYGMIYWYAYDHGLIDALRVPRTLGQVRQLMGYLPQREKTLEQILNILVQTGALRSFFTGEGHKVYVRTVPPSYLRFKEISGDLARGTGTMSSTHTIVPSLAFAALKDPGADIRFSSHYEPYWKSALEAPYYARGREMAADQIASPGRRVLDLASGQGHGLRRLARNVGAEGRVLGVDVSDFHLAVSRQAVHGHPTIEIRKGDLDEGLGFLPNASFDGAMIIGAFHFLRRKEGLISEVARVLRPGSRFVIGNCYLDVDTFDRPYMDLMFGITNPESRAIPSRPDVLRSLLDSYGFELYFEYAVGCYGWFHSQKR
jgi:ubiquinone/menaquinone biosynthesis C-methylase UbiE